MTFDPKKPFTTLDGRKARLLAHDLKNDHPLVVAVENPHMKIETVNTYRKDGTTSYGFDESTLVNIPEREEFFFNVYVTEMVQRHISRQHARNSQAWNAIGVMRVVKAGKKVVEQEYFPNEK